MNSIQLAIPNKGRLLEDTLSIMERAGVGIKGYDPRRLTASTVRSDYSVVQLRASDIPNFVSKGVFQAGITGLDRVKESRPDLEILLEMDYGTCSLCVAVPEDSPWSKPEDLPERFDLATSFPNISRDFFMKLNKHPDIIRVDGATEAAPAMGIAEVITDLVSTGKTLRMNRLKIIGTILHSSAVLVVSPAASSEERKLIEELAEAFRSVMRARKKRYLMANAPRRALPEIRSFLPGLCGPTVVDIYDDPDSVAIHVVVDEEAIYEAVIRLKTLGATGILILPVDRMVP